MLKPEWVIQGAWRELELSVDEIVMNFIYSLPAHEYERLRSDNQLFALAIEQVQQKLVSTLETYRSKGMYAGYANN